MASKSVLSHLLLSYRVDIVATYHTTRTLNAKASFNFTGTSLYIYGASGPDEGNTNYTIVIDPSGSQPFNQTYSTNVNGTNGGRATLIGLDGLRWDQHVVEIINTGSGLTLDLIEIGGFAGAEG